MKKEEVRKHFIERFGDVKGFLYASPGRINLIEIGRASCRERV